MPERRLERVAQQVQAEIGRVLLTGARDPRLAEVVVTGVRMSGDLRVARVYVRSLGDASGRLDKLRALERAAPFLRGEVGRALGLRTVPQFRFEWDETPDTARRVEHLLQSLPRAPRDDDGERDE